MDNESRKMYEDVCGPRMDDIKEDVKDHRNEMRESFRDITEQISRLTEAIVGNGKEGLRQKVDRHERSITMWSRCIVGLGILLGSPAILYLAREAWKHITS